MSDEKPHEIRTGVYIGREGYEGIWWHIVQGDRLLARSKKPTSPGEATRAAEAALERLKREARH